MTSTVGITTTSALDRALLDAAGLRPGGHVLDVGLPSATRPRSRHAGSGRPTSGSVSTTR
jgi:hypothetical protein